jgi:hypothetical protein
MAYGSPMHVADISETVSWTFPMRTAASRSRNGLRRQAPNI